MSVWDQVFLQVKDWTATLFIGFCVTSWWRGSWVLLDLWLCQQPSNAGITTADSFCYAGYLDEYSLNLHRINGWYSIAIGYSFLFIGVSLMWMGMWRPNVVDIKDKVKLDWVTVALRVIILYCLGIAAVNQWRGVWYLTDYYILPTKGLVENDDGIPFPLTSYWVTSVVGSTVCFLFAAGPSILAPPGIFLIDGPGVNPPPAAVTLVSSHYSVTLPAGEKVPELSYFVIFADLITSFIIIPIFVVWFWRGSWLVLDFYLWNFSIENHDVWLSIAWSTIIALIFMVLTSETVFSFIIIENKVMLGLLGRLRTYVLAWGVVNFWRAVWYIWDESFGTSPGSAWVCHIVPLIVLSAIGCMSCILAPSSTMGVDFVPHPDCADEPLFSNLPVPADDLYFFGIARDPQVMDETTLPPEAVENEKQYVRMSILASSAMFDIKDEPEKEIEMTSQPSDSDLAKGPETKDTVETEDAEVPKMKDAAVVAAKSQESDDGDAEADEAAIHVLAATWASGGTGGRRATYSSVRTHTEARRASYFDLQRPDLDRRVGHRSSLRRSMQESQAGKPVRRSSELFRSR